MYVITEHFTYWNDDEIEKCAADICKNEMRGKYHLINVNCQTLVNTVAEKIAVGSVPYTPYQTVSHVLGAGPTQEVLLGVRESDRKAVKLRGSSMLEPVDSTLRARYGQSAAESSRRSAATGELIDLDKARRPEGPLSIDEFRSNAFMSARGPTSRRPEIRQAPPFSLPDGYAEWQASLNYTSGQQIQRFPGEPGPFFQHVADVSGNFFDNHIKYRQESAARDEAMKVWDNPQVTEAERESKRKERRELENGIMRERRAVAQTIGRVTKVRYRQYDIDSIHFEEPVPLAYSWEGSEQSAQARQFVAPGRYQPPTGTTEPKQHYYDE